MAAYTLCSSIGRVCFYLCLLRATVSCQEQISPGSRYYSRDGVYVPSNRRTDTYVYKDRRYGYRPSYLDPVYRGPTKAPDTRYLYEVRYNKIAQFFLLLLQKLRDIVSKITTRTFVIL